MNNSITIKTANIRYKGKDALDVTVKSGDKTFAPSWDIVMRFRDDKITEQQYLAAYNSMMKQSWKENKKRWIEVANRESVTLTCYCSRHGFCHRNRLAEMIAAVAVSLGRQVIIGGYITDDPDTTNKPISEFRGEFAFLSNFYPSPIQLGTVEFPTVEHAFQASKTYSLDEHMHISTLTTPAAARRYGRSIALRADWEDVKVDIMRTLLEKKFKLPHLREKLLATRDREISHDNSWRDTYWGTCNGSGKDMLGILLMKVREGIRAKEESK